MKERTFVNDNVIGNIFRAGDLLYLPAREINTCISVKNCVDAYLR